MSGATQSPPSAWRRFLQAAFTRYAIFSMRRPWLCLLLPALVLIAIGRQLPMIETDAAFERFFDPEADMYLTYKDFKETFGNNDFFLVMVQTDNLYDTEFLKRFRDFHHALEDVDYIERVESLANARYIESEDDELLISELLENIPENTQGMAGLAKAIADNPVYQDRLISKDQHYLAIMLTTQSHVLQTDASGVETARELKTTEHEAALTQLQAVVDEYRGFTKDIKIGGSSAVGIEVNRAIKRDFSVFTGASIVLIILFLWVMFRRLSGIVLPMIVIICGTVITLGLMPVLGYSIQVTTTILPSFLLAICVGDSVHLLSYFYQAYDKTGNKATALTGALEHTGIPMLFTSLTTTAGLISFAFAELIPVAGLGLFGAIGAMVAFACTVLILPPMLWALPIRQKQRQPDSADDTNAGWVQLILGVLFRWVHAHYKSIVVISLTLFAAGIWSVKHIPFSNDAIDWFDEDVEIRQAVVAAEKVLAGTTTIEMYIDTGTPNGVLDPVFLQRLDTWLGHLDGKTVNGIKIGSVTSLADLVKETNRAMHDNDQAYYVIPDTAQLISQELLLIELDQQDELSTFVDPAKQKLRIALIIPWVDAMLYADFIDELRASYDKEVGLHPLKVTGMSTLLGLFFSGMAFEVFNSYLAAFCVITLMMILLIGDLRLGLISMIPNLIPIACIVLVMWIFDVHFTIFTLLIGSIAIGLSVDDTVHFMHGFKQNLDRYGDVEKAIEETLFVTGGALLTTSVVLCCGFLTYTLSSLVNLVIFGLLTASVAVFALLADLVLAPALLLFLYKKHQPTESSNGMDEEPIHANRTI